MSEEKPVQTKRTNNPSFSSRKLKPKHLRIDVSEKKRRAGTTMVYKQSIHDLIKREKMKSLKPLKDLESIMKQFDRKLGNDQPKKVRRGVDKDAEEIQKKINTILSLPTIRKIKIQAKQYRLQTETLQIAPLFIFREIRKKELLQDYNKYIMGEVHRPEKRNARHMTQY